jgi:biotin transport system substrate-specific component
MMSVRAPTVAFVDAVAPRPQTFLWNSAVVVLFGTLMAAFARLSIPLPYVPITGQTLGLLLTGALLGSGRGAAAMLVYLAEGLVGLPVFAGGTTAWSPTSLGVPVILGPSAGYLYSYPLAAFVVGFLAERGWDRNFGRAALAMLAGEVMVYAVGVPWLARFIGLGGAVVHGVLPFVVGDGIKLAVAAAVLPSGWRLLATLGKPDARRERDPTVVAVAAARERKPGPRPEPKEKQSRPRGRPRRNEGEQPE